MATRKSAQPPSQSDEDSPPNARGKRLCTLAARRQPPSQSDEEEDLSEDLDAKHDNALAELLKGSQFEVDAASAEIDSVMADVSTGKVCTNVELAEDYMSKKQPGGG